jgi:hypothetical protein
VTSHGIEILGTGQAMQSLDKRVVQNEHEGSSPPCPSLTPEEHLTNIADVLDFRVAQAELPVTLSDWILKTDFTSYVPKNQGSVQDQSSNDNGQNQTRNQTQSGVRVWE